MTHDRRGVSSSPGRCLAHCRVGEKCETIVSKGSGVITIAYISNDPESLFLAIQISKAFENTNWQVRSEGRTYATRLLWGITIPAHEGKETDILRNAFRDAGIPFFTTDVPAPDMAFSGPGESAAMIMIGSKPPPF